MHESFQDRLYIPAIDVVAMTIAFQPREGWHVRVAHRHSGEEWIACPHDAYGPLDAALVLEVTDAALSGLLGWP